MQSYMDRFSTFLRDARNVVVSNSTELSSAGNVEIREFIIFKGVLLIQ